MIVFHAREGLFLLDESTKRCILVARMQFFGDLIIQGCTTIFPYRLCVFMLPQGLAGEDRANALLGMADWLQAEGFYPQAAETYSKVKTLKSSLSGL